ncbi:hypothetical protein PHYC_02087 [Phycisphaerales bacterium]|nr:hypothetical protein PHYC_02087 [Phycisphaerales bacterium]
MSRTRLNPRRESPRIAFTLMEMMVAIAAVAVVSVGLAAMFSAVGRTVSGGKRVSLLNNYAGLLESRMRRDFEAMTREGFMVIRQQWVQKVPQETISGIPFAIPGPDSVAVDEEGRNERPRRSDEIMFFTRGNFKSARQPLYPGVTAESHEARVYYGMGQRMIPDLNDDAYRMPRVYEKNLDTTARLGAPGGPNQYAGDWTLLRLETLLVDQKTATSAAAFVAPGNLVAGDTDWQIGLQPAVASVFRRLALMPGGAAPASIRFDSGLAATKPTIASGIVDVATSNLSEVRMVILGMAAAQSGMGVIPDNVNLGVAYPSANYIGTSYDWSSSPAAAIRPPTPESVDVMHSWMDQAWPAQSATARLTGTFYPCSTDIEDGIRVRYEPQPPDLLQVIKDQTAGAYQVGYQRADQLMLASNNLLPHCSEFIVEWSLGMPGSDGGMPGTSGEVAWYGLTRWRDLNGNGIPDGNDTEMVNPYPFDSWGVPRYLNVGYKRLDGTSQTHPYTERVFYGYNPNPLSSVLTTYFGYTDPTFRPPRFNANGTPINQQQPTTPSVPWPWPRMIRVTVTISDAQDPAIESTFQFVFSTPEDPGIR